MTAVIFKFQKPDGTPVVDAPFTVSLRKSSFDEQGDGGILLPGDVAGLTDAQGMCTLELAEGHGIYYLTMVPAGASVDSEGCTVGLRYKFIVPVSATPVRVEDLIVTTPTFSRPWDEVALAKITQAVIDSRNSEIAAAASAVRAENAAVTIEGDADRAEAAAMVALASKDSATASASAAVGAATDALASKNAAVASQNAANNSAISASNDATLAGQRAAAALASQNAAASSATTATQQATAAGQAKTAAETAASTATTKAGEAASSASAAAGSASTANTKASEASASATAAKTSETNAKTSETNAATSASNASTAGAAAGTAAANAVVANKQDKHINLTAFAGLAGAVDALPYFTGAGALSLATLTAKARLLLARTDTAGMQAELDLVPVTSNTDVTVGRLMAVGYRGGPGSSVLVNEGNAINPDIYLTAGNFYGEFAMAEWAGAGQPTTNVIGWLTVTPGVNTATSCAQTFTNAANGFTFVRAKVSGVWARWAKQFNALNAEQDPQSSLGLMSSTVVSGWTISKYANGEIVLVSPFDSIASLAANELRVVDVNIPVTLISSKPAIALATLTPASVYDFTVPSTWMPGPTYVRFAIKNGGTAQTFNRSIMVRGMWK